MQKTGLRASFIEFRGMGIGISFIINSGATQPYKCQRVKGYTETEECINLMADNEYAAYILCGLEAGRRNWLSGKHSPGLCENDIDKFRY